jgi:hypothetical protein
MKIENQFDKCKKMFNNDNRMVEINIDELDTEAEDVIITPEELASLTDLIKENIGLLNNSEFEYLENRGFGEKTILDWDILGLSNITHLRHHQILGSTCHPVLKKIMTDGIENGGILIPLFEDDVLVNCSVRKINSSKSLKYSLACPDIPVWGLDKIEDGDEFWITEGVFDTMAIYELGEKSVSCSSAMWSGIQLYQLLEKKPKMIKFFSDNDEVGLRTSAILSDFFNQYDIETKIFISEDYKDASELYFLKKLDLSTLKEIEVTDDMININKDNSFNFIEHLKNRKF